jgi:hypothetical protein
MKTLLFDGVGLPALPSCQTSQQCGLTFPVASKKESWGSNDFCGAGDPPELAEAPKASTP